jgi:hypothetical protein
MGLLRYDATDDKHSGFSGSAGICLTASSTFKLHTSFYRQRIFPDMHTLYWPPSGYPDLFEIGAISYRESGNPDLPVGTRDAMEIGGRLSIGILSIQTGASYSICEDHIRYQHDGTPVDIVYTPSAEDYDFITAFSRVSFNNVMDMVDVFAEGRLNDIEYDDGYEFYPIPQYQAYFGGTIKRELFVKGLLFRGGIEISYTDWRYVPGYTPRFEDYYWIVNSGFTISYKDLTFFYNGDNITDQIYYSNGENPVLGRWYWWGISWDFFN